ncbi:hypothetical protein LOCC1_G002205 [Lachnellula occidentalis]|uniref:Acyltransferase 3 domain-containing protein n=1 Tax=Lachnellula occidentalis TaxID=215460 RepID=A0A8H8S5V7_9HELO|nr:hypothetical protein LOCC1_G002205 [Lachnellula occidentalis]
MASRPLLVDSNDDNSIIDLEEGEKVAPTLSPFRNFLSSTRAFLCSLFFAILPSFIQPLLRHQTSKPPNLNSGRSNALTYLTGIRGVASVIVFIYHWTHGLFHNSMDHAYGDITTTNTSEPSSSSATQSSHNHIMQLPPLRLFYAAEAMVALFFVLSGYVLSYRPIQQMNKPSCHLPATPTSTLSSLAFRRAPRLFLPAIAATLLAFLTQLTGALKLPSTPPPSTSTSTSFPGQSLSTLLLFLHSLLITGVWTWDTFPGPPWSLSPHLWTVPTEFRCSMVLFTLLLTISNRTRTTRLIVEAGVTAWCLTAGRWDVALFTAGAVLAELRVRREESESELLRASPSHRHAPCTIPNLLRTTALLAALLTGLLLATYPRIPPLPRHPSSGPSHSSSETPATKKRGGSLDRLPGLQRLFTTRLPLYFGRVAYALYLVHGLLIRVVGQRVLDAVWRAGARGEGGGRGEGVKFGVASVVFVPVVVWGADLFERGVERRVVGWARSL